MILRIKNEKLYENELINEVENKISKLNQKKSYNIIVEFYNDKMINSYRDADLTCEIEKDQIILQNKIREYFNKKNINIKKLYILGSNDFDLMEEAKIAIEETNDKEETKNIIWPCKEVFFYDGGKKILDDMLDNDEIDIVEYESQIKTLKYEFGFLEDLEDELYLN